MPRWSANPSVYQWQGKRIIKTKNSWVFGSENEKLTTNSMVGDVYQRPCVSSNCLQCKLWLVKSLGCVLNYRFLLQCLSTISSYTLNNGQSKYMNDVLYIPIEENSIYTTIPHIVVIFASILAGFMSDFMLTKCNIHLTTVRKTFVLLCKITCCWIFHLSLHSKYNLQWKFSATVPPAIFAILVSYGECDETFVVTMFSLAISTQGLGSSGLVLVPFDLAPNYIGPFSGIVSTSYAAAALVAPLIVGIFTPHVNQLMPLSKHKSFHIFIFPLK